MFVCALLFALASEDSSEHRFRLAVAAFGLSFSDQRQQFELDISAGTGHSFSTYRFGHLILHYATIILAR